MKKIIFTFLLTLPILMNAQQWEWAKKATTTGDQEAKDICVDKQGNVFILGYNWDQAYFGTSPIKPLYKGYFIAKFTNSGTFLWSKMIGGEPNDMGTDAAGNLYISGSYTANLTTSTTSFTSNGYEDMYVIKYQPNGTEIWARSYGGKSGDGLYAIVVDDPGNVYITGSFRDTVQFNSIVVSCSSIYGREFFVAKLNSLGIASWVKKSIKTNVEQYIEGNSICVDKNSNVYTTGIYYEDSCQWFCQRMFVMKHDQNGNLLMDKGLPYSTPLSISVDNNLNIFLFSHYGMNTTSENWITKYSQSFNTSWSTKLGEIYGTCYYQDYGIGIDNLDNIYFSGRWGLGYSVCDSDLIYNQMIHKKGETDLLITKFQNNGTHLLTKNEGRKGSVSGGPIAVDGAGNCYVVSNYNLTGYYNNTVSDTVVFDKDTLTNDGPWSQIFIAKLKSTNPITTTIPFIANTPDKPFEIYPNPNNGQFTLQTKPDSEAKEVCVYDHTGKCVLHTELQKNISTAQIDLSSQPKGFYYIEVNVNNVLQKQKLIVQ